MLCLVNSIAVWWLSPGWKSGPDNRLHCVAVMLCWNVIIFLVAGVARLAGCVA